MIRSFPWIGWIVWIGALLCAGCKQLEPVERPFFLAGWSRMIPSAQPDIDTHPVLVFRTPGFGLWSEESTVLEMGNAGSVELMIGEVEVVELPAGVHRVGVRPGREGLEYCELELRVTAGTPAPYIEVFERQNPAGKILSSVLAEVEAAIKFPVDRGMTCFGHFGVRQGVVPAGISLDQAKVEAGRAD